MCLFLCHIESRDEYRQPCCPKLKSVCETIYKVTHADVQKSRNLPVIVPNTCIWIAVTPGREQQRDS